MTMPTLSAQPVMPPASLAPLLERFRAVRAETMAFIQPLSAEDLMVQSCAEASPGKWHLAHTSWFFETFVLAPRHGYRAFHPDFAWLFNSYYNALGEMPEKKLRASFSRPSLDAILAYRTHVDRAIEALLTSPLDAPAGDEIARLITLGLHHEQQHLELLATDLKHAFFTNPLHPAYREPSAPLRSGVAAPLAWTSFAGGLAEAGITPDPADPLAFAFDNETPRHTIYLHPFQLADRLATCREYLAFIDDNAYSRPELWLSEGWTTVRAENWQAPHYWRRSAEPGHGSGWEIFTLDGFRPLDHLLDTPVCHLSLFEADAFARWSGKRLPTEFEWEHAAAQVHVSPANMLEGGNLHPTVAPTGAGPQQLFGDCWEWTSSGYTGYPGYTPPPGALGEYNGKFMSSQVILRGGSCVTPASHIRASYRNFFPPATRWQFTGVRLAQDNPPIPPPSF